MRKVSTQKLATLTRHVCQATESSLSCLCTGLLHEIGEAHGTRIALLIGVRFAEPTEIVVKTRDEPVERNRTIDLKLAQRIPASLGNRSLCGGYVLEVARPSRRFSDFWPVAQLPTSFKYTVHLAILRGQTIAPLSNWQRGNLLQKLAPQMPPGCELRISRKLCNYHRQRAA